MSSAYVADLCSQLDNLGSVAGKSVCLRTRTGKVQVDNSITGLVWRKLINTEDESRLSAVQGIENLLATTNEYVSSIVKDTPIVRNVFVSLAKAEGKVLDIAPTGVEDESPQERASLSDKEQSGDDKALLGAQKMFFSECRSQERSGLQALSSSLAISCKGIADLLSRRYNNDYEIVPLLFDEINFATLIKRRIDEYLERQPQK